MEKVKRDKKGKIYEYTDEGITKENLLEVVKFLNKEVIFLKQFSIPTIIKPILFYGLFYVAMFLLILLFFSAINYFKTLSDLYSKITPDQKFYVSGIVPFTLIIGIVSFFFGRWWDSRKRKKQ